MRLVCRGGYGLGVRESWDAEERAVEAPRIEGRRGGRLVDGRAIVSELLPEGGGTTETIAPVMAHHIEDDPAWDEIDLV